MNQTEILQLVIPILVALLTSSGFWIYVGTYRDRKSYQTELLIGLAHNEIVKQGMYYINRGYITQDEYENLNVYLFAPYEKLGGNGSVKRIMLEVDKLPIKKRKIHDSVDDALKTGDTLP